jgi:recombination protein RecA
MNKNDRSILLGMLLGDGCLKRKHHTKKDGSESVYYEYVLCHSIKQKDYLEHKLNIFHRIMGGKRPSIHKEKSKLGESVRFSRCHKSFRILHKYLYSKNNKKYITERVLNYLTPEAIAIWYMDDGGVKPSFRPDGTVSSCQMILSTYCPPEEADLILGYFSSKWDIWGAKKLHKKSNSWYLVFNTKEGKKLEELISPYIIPSMSYKLPSNRITRVLGTQTGSAVGDDIV